MSFDDAMDPAYLEGIQPAVEQDCRFTCVNLKHLLHNDDITDRMLAEIRRCQILVADFTQQKHGVYYEAGFALALGKEVIWCVRIDEMNKVLFDTITGPTYVGNPPTPHPPRRLHPAKFQKRSDRSKAIVTSDASEYNLYCDEAATWSTTGSRRWFWRGVVSPRTGPNHCPRHLRPQTPPRDRTFNRGQVGQSVTREGWLLSRPDRLLF